tara:strand:- start:77 stop:505 length:429 start_codon:yes stop_codon:yes gene_type:complete
MYRDLSNQSGDLSQARVQYEIIKLGWIASTPISRDSVADLVVDRGNGKFERIQVKTMSGNSISKIIDRSGERVSHNGKTRNSIDYAEHGIDWLAGVDLRDEKVYFYHISNYSKIPTKSFSVKKYKPDLFPKHDVPNRHSKKK